MRPMDARLVNLASMWQSVLADRGPRGGRSRWARKEPRGRQARAVCLDSSDEEPECDAAQKIERGDLRGGLRRERKSMSPLKISSRKVRPLRLVQPTPRGVARWRTTKHGPQTQRDIKLELKLLIT